MSNRTASIAGGALLVAMLLTGNTGCHVAAGPTLGILNYPIPVTPWLQDEMEDRFWDHERYARAPVLEPLPPGVEAQAMDPPSPDEVMRTLERARPVEGGIPLLFEVQRNNVRIVTELIADYLDPPRFYPLVGPAQLHHCHYKCTVYFTETKRIGWPVPYTTVDEDTVEVVYIDHDHLHMVGNVDGGEVGNY